MKIGSHIKPRHGDRRVVKIDETDYAFSATKDKAGQVHFVAEVNDPDHAALLLENGAFYPFDKAQAPQPKLTRNGAEGSAPAKEYPAEIAEEAKALLANKPSAMATAVGKVSSPDVVECALVAEKAGDKRKDVLTLLQATLDGIAAAGVKG